MFLSGRKSYKIFKTCIFYFAVFDVLTFSLTSFCFWLVVVARKKVRWLIFVKIKVWATQEFCWGAQINFSRQLVGASFKKKASISSFRSWRRGGYCQKQGFYWSFLGNFVCTRRTRKWGGDGCEGEAKAMSTEWEAQLEDRGIVRILDVEFPVSGRHGHSIEVRARFRESYRVRSPHQVWHLRQDRFPQDGESVLDLQRSMLNGAKQLFMILSQVE